MISPEFISFTNVFPRLDLLKADALARKYPIEWVITKTELAELTMAGLVEQFWSISGMKSLKLCPIDSHFVSNGIVNRKLNISAYDRVFLSGEVDTHSITDCVASANDVAFVRSGHNGQQVELLRLGKPTRVGLSTINLTQASDEVDQATKAIAAAQHDSFWLDACINLYTAVEQMQSEVELHCQAIF